MTKLGVTNPRPDVFHEKAREGATAEAAGWAGQSSNLPTIATHDERFSPSFARTRYDSTGADRSHGVESQLLANLVRVIDFPRSLVTRRR